MREKTPTKLFIQFTFSRCIVIEIGFYNTYEKDIDTLSCTLAYLALAC